MRRNEISTKQFKSFNKIIKNLSPTCKLEPEPDVAATPCDLKDANDKVGMNHGSEKSRDGS